MFCQARTFLFPLLATFFVFASALLDQASVGSRPSAFPAERTSEHIFGEKHGVMLSWGTSRVLAEGPNPDAEAPLNSSNLILAARRTRRKDPLNGLQKYTGGWNISERHYWASVAYTAVPFFVIAAVWFIGFGLCLLVICCRHCCCRREPYGYSRIAYAISLILLIVFTIAAIVGCIVLYIGQGKYHSSTTNTLGYIVHQADLTVENLHNVSEYLDAARQIGVDSVALPSNVQSDIDRIQSKINSSASTLGTRTADNSKDIRSLLDATRLALIILSAVMLFLTFAGFVLSIFGLQGLVYILVIIAWILVAGTFILCGIFLLLHYVTGDTCVAMNQWVQNPTAHTALDDILPCVDNATAQETLIRSKEVSSQVVNLINQVITNVSNVNFSPNFRPLYYNQSGPLMPLLCNPFNPDLTNRTCSAGEVDLYNATQVWKNYVCQVSGNTCVTQGRLTPAVYSQMSAGVNVSFGLYAYGPFLVELQDCTFVRRTFTDIYSTYCPGLRRYSKWIYSGLVMVASAVMLSILFWVIYGRERRHRVYTKQHMSGPPRGYEGEGDKHT